MNTVRGALQPHRAGARRDAEAGRGRGERRGRRGGRSASRFAADYRVVADTAAFNTSFAGVALTADSGSPGRCPGCRPGPRRRSAALPAQRHARRRRTSWASRTRSCPPTSWPPRPQRWPGSWPRARRWRTRRSRSRSPTAPSTRWPRRWRRRTSSRRGRARREDHTIAVRGLRQQGEAEVPGQ